MTRLLAVACAGFHIFGAAAFGQGESAPGELQALFKDLLPLIKWRAYWVGDANLRGGAGQPLIAAARWDSSVAMCSYDSGFCLDAYPSLDGPLLAGSFKPVQPNPNVPLAARLREFVASTPVPEVIGAVVVQAPPPRAAGQKNELSLTRPLFRELRPPQIDRILEGRVKLPDGIGVLTPADLPASPADREELLGGLRQALVRSAQVIGLQGKAKVIVPVVSIHDSEAFLAISGPATEDVVRVVRYATGDWRFGDRLPPAEVTGYRAKIRAAVWRVFELAL